MLIRNTDRLDELIVLTLAKRGSATASWLQTHIEAGIRSCTLQGVYKELRKLQRDGIVVKHGDQFSLNLTWILSQMELLDTMYKTHVLGGLVETIFPAPGEKVTWRFTNVHKVDDFLMHVNLALLECSKSKTMYQWVPHPWGRLLQGEKSRVFREAVRNSGYRIFSILGRKTLSLMRYELVTKSDVYQYSTRKGPFDDERSRYYYSVDDFLLTLTLDRKTTENYESLYSKLRAIDDFYRTEVLTIAKTPVSITVRLELGTKRAHRIGRKFSDYFGS